MRTEAAPTRWTFAHHSWECAEPQFQRRYLRGKCAYRAPHIRRDYKPMRAFTVVLLVLTVATHAADTAYTALRALGAQRGEDSLHRVIELRGSRDTWKILLADSRARTGLREIQVRNGRIIRDVTVTKPHDITTPLNLSALNLDSDGALIIVNQQASVFDTIGEPVAGADIIL